MDSSTFNDLVDSIVKVAVSCDFSVPDAESSIWDGIKDAGYTWAGQPISDDEFMDAGEAAEPLVEELRVFYNSVARYYMRT